MMIYIAAISYAITRFTYMITRVAPQISRNQLVRGNDDPEERYFDPFKENFYFLARVDFRDAAGEFKIMTPEYG